jgi:hypothetical protein
MQQATLYHFEDADSALARTAGELVILLGDNVNRTDVAGPLSAQPGAVKGIGPVMSGHFTADDYAEFNAAMDAAVAAYQGQTATVASELAAIPNPDANTTAAYGALIATRNAVQATIEARLAAWRSIMAGRLNL